MSVRGLGDHALRALGVVLYALGLARFVIWLTRRIPRVVLYHACEGAESDYTRGLRSNITPDALAMHLKFFRRYYRVVEPERLAAPDRLPPAAVCITFDDGFRSVFNNAWPLLAAAAMPAIVYLVAEVLEPGRLLWVNELNWWLQRHGDVTRPVAAAELGLPEDATPARIVAAARELGQRRRIDQLLARVREAGGPEALGQCYAEPQHIDRTMVAAMAAGGVRFGSHTGWHPSLPYLAGWDRFADIVRGRDAVVALPGACNSFAYPFGDVDRETRAAAKAAGFASIMEVGGVSWPPDPTRLARVPVHATTPGALFAELEIVGPIKGALKRLAEWRPVSHRL